MEAVMAQARSQTSGDDKFALRQAQLAGWYVHGGTWKQLAPNVRDKVQVRRAHKQPDGRFVVTDVPVFYPNAVKPKLDAKGHRIGTLAWSAEEINEVCKNTNASIGSGSQAPPLRLGHYTAEQRAIGIQPPAYGRAVNFRQWKNGMLLCDLVDIESEFAKDWMAGRQNGLSAGFVADDMGLNLRVGHVARLGAEPQALAYLPCTEIFSGDQFAFSADPAAPLSSYEGNPMKMKKSQCLAQMSAAYAAKEVGEKGWEDKVKEAEASYAAAMTEDVSDPTVSPADVSSAAGTAGATGSNGSTDMPFNAAQFSASIAHDPAQAILGIVAPIMANQRRLDAQLSAVLRKIESAEVTTQKSQFSAQVTELSKSHEFSADEWISQYDAVGGNQNVLSKIIDALKKFPPREKSLADLGQVVDRTVASDPFVQFSATTMPSHILDRVSSIDSPQERKSTLDFIGAL